jgi:hypothetical protein
MCCTSVSIHAGPCSYDIGVEFADVASILHGMFVVGAQVWDVAVWKDHLIGAEPVARPRSSLTHPPQR